MLTLPAYKWKWRMRHAAVTMAEKVAAARAGGNRWDGVFCTDMLNLAEFRGLCDESTTRLPTIVYFHENQLTYPVRHPTERDLHFAFTNLTSALAANRVWFNSAFHREEFLSAMDDWLPRLPDFQPRTATSVIRAKSEVHPPGIEAFARRTRREPGPLRVLWAARWEHDKDPDTFFQALELLKARGCDFTLRVVGQSFADTPACFHKARNTFQTEIDHWGFAPERETYRALLEASDVIVSTARHEFFGISVVEAIAAGCFPLVPRRLAYPEMLGNRPHFFHDGTASGLADRLEEQSGRLHTTDNLWQDRGTPAKIVARFDWEVVAKQMDDAIDSLA
jgi:glycosyltransferase involved in cell wall biosynthesis